MNIKLLQQIKTAILAEPDAFRMDTWSCGTAHCIAGWALHLNALKIADVSLPAHQQLLVDGRTPDAVADELLGIDEDAGLFNVSDWPWSFQTRYEAAMSRAERAAIAAEVIDAFIVNDGFGSCDDDYDEDQW